MPGPIDAVLAVTYRCNSRCTMCNIWQAEPQDEDEITHYRRLPPSLRSINVSGGEPFLRGDLPAIIAAIKTQCRRGQIIISSNGLQPQRIRKLGQQILRLDPGIGVGVSIDGIGEVHDRIRGVSGAYERALESVRVLQELGCTNLRLAYTATQGNAGQMVRVYNLANELGVQFTCAVAHSSDHYFGTDDTVVPDGELLDEELKRLSSSELRSSSPKRWLRSYFTSGLRHFVAHGRRPLPCDAGRDFFFMSPRGDIYPCNIRDEVMGNLRESNFSTLWTSDQANRVRAAIAGCSICWMICTARTAIRRHPLQIGWWILANKARGHLEDESSIEAPGRISGRIP